MSKNRLKWWVLYISLFTVQIAAAQSETPVSEEEVRKLKTSENDLWYADLPLPEEEKAKEDTTKRQVRAPVWISLLLKIIAWGALAAVLGYIIYVITQQVKLNRGAVNQVIEDDLEITTQEDLQRIDFQQSIQRALRKENYRLAVRFYYLWIIQQLSDDGLITFSKDKTNHAYVRELAQSNSISSGLTTGFKNCTRLYEYVWFGNFDVNKRRFEEIESQFSFILNQPAG